MPYIISGITSDGIILNNDSMTVLDGGIANSTTVNSKGFLYVSGGGTANKTTVNSGGSMYVSVGGTADDATVKSAGRLYVSGGGKLTGKQTFDSGAVVSAYSDAIIDFDLTRTSAGAEALVNGLSAIRGTPTYTLTVSGTQANGLYSLADGVSKFTATITVVNTAGEELGTLKRGKAVSIGGADYTLSLRGANLLLAVGVEAPPEVRITSSGLELVNASKSVNSSQGYLDTTVRSGGILSVTRGGTTFDTKVSSGGLFHVSSGGEASSNTVSLSGSMFVSEGGTAFKTTLDDGGWLYVSSGGTADSVTIDSGGRLYVSRGGSAINIVWTPGVGGVQIEDAGYVSFASALAGVYYASNHNLLSSGILLESVAFGFAGSMYVMSGGTAKGTMVASGGTMYVHSGGTANKTSALDSGRFHVLSGGTATSSFTRYTGVMIVHSGGAANSTTLRENGILDVYSGGSADNISVAFGGRLIVSSGATATNIEWTPGIGDVQVDHGGYATFVSQYTGVYFGSDNQLVYHRDSVQSMWFRGQTLSMYVYAGGTVQNVTVSSGGNMYVRSDGVAKKTYIQSAGRISVSSGGIANHTSVNQSGTMFVMFGGTANSTTLTSGTIILSSGGTANNTVVLAGGISVGAGVVYVSGGEANDTVLHSGWMDVLSGGVANSTTINDYGSMFVYTSGMANSVTVNGAGILHVGYSSGTWLESGGKASDTVLSGGSMSVAYGGVADRITVHSNGYLVAFSGGAVNSATINPCGKLHVTKGGTGNEIIENGGYVNIVSGVKATFASNTFSGLVLSSASATVHSGTTANSATVNSGGSLYVFSGGKLTGKQTFDSGAVVSAYDGAILNFDLTQTSAGAEALTNDLSIIQGVPLYTLTVDGTQTNGVYSLAAGAAAFIGALSVRNKDGNELGTLTVGSGKQNIGGVDYTLNLDDGLLSVAVESAVVVTAARGDRDGNGVSDVMFVWTGNNYAHGYWMNGTSEWWSANSTGVSADWDNLGSYDMSGDGKADAVMFGNVVVNDAKGAYIGYYQDGDDATGWVNIGFLDNSANTDWKNAVGNLTGGAANSIVWYAPELYALGAWTDGTDTWVSLSGTFGGAEWTLVGCGDFDGDGKDSVVMAYNGGQMFYTANLDGATASLGNLNWSGWDVRAIGDFAGDGRDDIVLFHAETGSMVMLANGSADDYSAIGQLDPNDWFVAGCGDYNGDGADDLLVRQYSTGMLGYYSNGDTTRWVELGRGVDMDWTVIA